MKYQKLSNASTHDLLKFHRSLLADRVRTESYRDAIFETIRLSDIVADVGCGSGILSFFAAQAGAKRVIAIDEGPVIELARSLAIENKLDQKIVFINASSFDVDLDEKVDVIITETMGNNGLDEQIVLAVNDARTRWLRKDGVIIPRRLEIVAAPCTLTRIHDDAQFWSAERYGVDLSRVREHAMNTFYPIDIDENLLVDEGHVIATIDFDRENDGNVRGSASFTASRTANVTGIAVWFRADLARGTGISNEPPNLCVSWKQSFFPIATPMPVERGEPIAIEMHTFNGIEWRWSIASGEKRAEQATLRGFPLLTPPR